MNKLRKLTNLPKTIHLAFAGVAGGLIWASATIAQELPPPIEPTVPPLSEMLGGGTTTTTGTPSAIEAVPPPPMPVPVPAPAESPVEPLPPPIDPATPVSPMETPLDPTGVPAPIEPLITPAIPAPPPTVTTDVTTIPAVSLPALGDTGGGSQAREFGGDDVGTVLRLLARQAKINLVVSESVVGSITMRLENVTAFEAIRVIVTAEGLFMDEVDNVFYVKTLAEKAAEPQEEGNYRFSYARAEKIAPLLQQQLISKAPPIVDERTNTIFYREVVSNGKGIATFLETIDTPTKQVMIEARLVEVNANPQQSYGINWAGVLGGADSAKVFRYGASALPETTFETVEAQNPDGTPRLDANGFPVTTNVAQSPVYTFESTDGVNTLSDFVLNGDRGTGNGSRFGNLLSLVPGASQFAILSLPQFSLSLRLLNEDQDAEFLAHPRIVTSDNQEATIKIVRKEPVPQLTFNAETATSEFSGFQEYEYGNTLVVRPTINKENFITLSVRPEISTKVGDAAYTLNGSNVTAPIIDTRNLDSNVLIRSGDTLAIGGLLQDETRKARTKVPFLGDIPIIGYAFQERLNSRTKRNLLIFVTPTVIDQDGTGLESQMTTGLAQSAEEYADPNGWINNARGSIRMVPSSQKQLTSRYPVPGQTRTIVAPLAPAP